MMCIGEINLRVEASPIGSRYATALRENFFGILLIQTEIRLYLPFSDLFGTKRKMVRLVPN